MPSSPTHATYAAQRILEAWRSRTPFAYADEGRHLLRVADRVLLLQSLRPALALALQGPAMAHAQRALLLLPEDHRHHAALDLADLARTALPVTRWDLTLWRDLVPPAVALMRVRDTAMTGRVRSLCDSLQLETWQDLLMRDPRPRLLPEGLGAQSMLHIATCLDALLTRERARCTVTNRDVVNHLHDAIANLAAGARLKDAEDAAIITRRLGLDRTRAQTLQEIALDLGVSRERVRQREQRIWNLLSRTSAWIEEARTRIHSLRDAGGGCLTLVDLVHTHTWLSGLCTRPELFHALLPAMGISGMVHQGPSGWVLVALSPGELHRLHGLIARTRRTLGNTAGHAAVIARIVGHPLASGLSRSALALLIRDKSMCSHAAGATACLLHTCHPAP